MAPLFAGHEVLLQQFGRALGRPGTVGWNRRRADFDDQPIVILHAPPGGGRTALLTWLHGQNSRQTPCAYVDFQQSELDSSRTALTETVFGLTKKARSGERRLKFPRHSLAMLACGLTLSGTDRSRALSALGHSLGERDGDSRLTQAVEAAIEAAAQLSVPLVSGAPKLVEFVLHEVSSGLLRRQARSRAMAWHAENASPPCQNGYDALVELSSRFQRNPSEIEPLLFHAFLADLEDAFYHEFRNGDRERPCLILLDNADGAVARRYLDLYEQARNRRANHGLRTDAAFVVAASRTEPPPTAPTSTADQLNRWRAERRNRNQWRYPVTLEGLRLSDVERLTAEFVPDADLTVVKGLLYRLAYGHPGFTVLALRTLRAMRDADATAPLSGLLGYPVPDTPGSPALATAGIDLLLGAPVANEVRHALRQAAPAADDAAIRALTDRGVLIRADLPIELSAGAWAPGCEPLDRFTRSSHDDRYVESKLLRRLLLEELGAPVRHTVHTALAASLPAASAEGLRHAFAASGDLRPLAGHFADQFPSDDIVDWWNRLNIACGAGVTSGRDPYTTYERLVGIAQDGGRVDGVPLYVTKLAAALAVDADPLGDPELVLSHGEFPNVLEALARDADRGSRILLQLANDYRERR